MADINSRIIKKIVILTYDYDFHEKYDQIKIHIFL